MKKILVVCGATATGKTELAARLARKFDGELISADSRQVYKFMDIGTGKDRPEGVVVWGYDLANPNEEFSVSQYVGFARRKIAEITARGNLPILVGGTGFYIKAVVDGIGTIDIPRNKRLREKLSKLSVGALQKKLRDLDPKKFKLLNDSDVNNPRRLIRAIEVVEFNKINKSRNQPVNINYDVLFVGLWASKEELKGRVGKRVDERIKIGFEEEVDFLKEKDFFKYIPSVTIGYKDWPDVEKWKMEEFKYAKRQVVWFKKNVRIKWFSVSQPRYQKKVELLVEKWQNISTDA